MEDIEDLFKNEDDQIESRIPQSQRKILRNKKKVEEKPKIEEKIKDSKDE